MEFANLIQTPRVEKAVLTRPFHKPAEGTLCITGHHFIFSSGARENPDELWLLHRNIDAVERKANGLLGGTITIKSKDFCILQLDISSMEDFTNVANSLEWLSSLDQQMYFYPFFYQPLCPMVEDGWTAFRPETEFSKIVLQDEWRICYVNKDFSICPTYDKCVIVPKSIDDDVLVAAAAFRQGGRFPVLSYRHENGAALLRSSQPITGPNVKRCREDERLLNAALKPGMRGYIIDTRTQSVAQSVKTKGGGYQAEIHYPQWRRIHKPIERRTTLLDSLSKLIEACNDTSASMDKWLSRLESSHWMTHVKETLNCACLVAQCLAQEGAAVLVHGAEGLDSTLIVTALAQIIANPDCRTVRGLEALVEREWLQAGHPFVVRHAYSAYTPSGLRSKDAAPTFLLFLDCCWQILQQFPCSFEYNEQFLLQLFRHSYCSQFGTFLGNCEAERLQLKLAAKTTSLWSYLNQPEVLRAFLNPVYEPNGKVVWPSVAPMSLTLWPALYMAWVVDPRPQQEAWGSITQICETDKALRAKAARLRRHLADLQKEAIEKGLLEPPPAAHME